MKIKNVYVGGWFQRTMLQLSEVYDFLRECKTKLKLDQKKLVKYRKNLEIGSIDYGVSGEEYIKFTSQYSKAPITQDYRWAKVKKDWGHTLCALYKDDKIVAASLLLIKTFPFNLKMIYSPKGFLLDYTNKEDLEEFTKGIKMYAKKVKAFVVKIDPLIALSEEYFDTLMEKDNKISPKNYTIDNTLKINNLKECGYIHCGFKKNIGAYIQPRYNMAIS